MIIFHNARNAQSRDIPRELEEVKETILLMSCLFDNYLIDLTVWMWFFSDFHLFAKRKNFLGGTKF